MEAVAKRPWIVRYFREAKEELQKVVWPTRKETIRYSALVIGVSVVLAAVIAGVDWLLAAGLAQLVNVAAK